MPRAAPKYRFGRRAFQSAAAAGWLAIAMTTTSNATVTFRRERPSRINRESPSRISIPGDTAPPPPELTDVFCSCGGGRGGGGCAVVVTTKSELTPPIVSTAVTDVPYDGG